MYDEQLLNRLLNSKVKSKASLLMVDRLMKRRLFKRAATTKLLKKRQMWKEIEQAIQKSGLGKAIS